MEALKVESHATPRITTLERAVILPTQEEQRRLLMTVLAGLGVFGLGLVGVAWWDFRLGKFATAEEAVDGLELCILGTLPLLSRDRRLELIEPDASTGTEQSVVFAEAVDATRTLLQHAMKRSESHCVLVTSATESEGKTSLAVALSVSLARAGFRTVLVDGDLRRPTIHSLFGLPEAPGLCELLRGERGTEEVVKETSLPRLSLLAAGKLDARAAQSLSHESAQAVFRALRDRYDYVIVDSSPVLPVAGTLQLARCVDGVVFSVLRDVSCLSASSAACQRLASLDVPLFGVVVQGVRGEAYGNYYTYSANETAK